MKRSVFAIGLIIGAALLARAVLAQPPGQPGRGGSPGGGFPPLPILAALDADGDGELSAKEIDNSATALRTLDKNKDGKLTRDELLPAVREGGPAGPNPGELVARLMAFDKNGDGKLSKDELPERMRGLLARADFEQGRVRRQGRADQARAAAGWTGPGPRAGRGRGGFFPKDGGRGPGEGRGPDREDQPRL